MKTREQAAAEHARVTSELASKPISQVFLEEATRLIEERDLPMNVKFTQDLRDQLVREFEKGHHRGCSTFLKIDYMDRDPKNIALGNILHIGHNWPARVHNDDFGKPGKTVSQMFCDRASALINDDMYGNKPEVFGVSQGDVVYKFEERFFGKIKEQSLSGIGSSPDYSAMARESSQEVVAELKGCDLAL